MSTAIERRRLHGGRRGGLILSGLAALALIAPAPVLAVSDIAAAATHLADRDARTGSIRPDAAQRSIVSGLGATVRWNRFGTPRSLIKYGSWLATGLRGSDADAARAWVRQNRALFRLTANDVTRLQLVSVNRLTASPARVVVFRQRFGDLTAGQDGLLIVGIRDGKIGYVSSSAAGSLPAPAPATLSARQAWLRAAADVGVVASAADLTGTRTEGEWTVFTARGLATMPGGATKGSPEVGQRARLVAVPTYNGTVRAAYETIVLDTSGAEPMAYTHFIDARSGNVLMRYDRVDHLADEPIEQEPAPPTAPTFGQFSDTTTAATGCGPDHPIDAPAGTRTIDIVANATNPVNDIVVYLLGPDPGRVEITHGDSGTSPEGVHYEFPVPTAVAATYYARVCEFNAAQPPFTYDGAFATNDVVSTPTDFFYPPKWRFFTAHPSLASDPSAGDPYDHVNTDTRVVGCWVKTVEGSTVPGCTPDYRPLSNLASRLPWDEDPDTHAPTFTTRGNNARSAEAWMTPLTPGPAQQMPVDTEREYDFPWTNQWNQSRCDPTNLVPGGNDIDASVTNLFAAHNRMHDWSYFLGFTEANWNLQQYNFGNNPGPGQEHDPEFGQAQAGALIPLEAGVSRNNANQITLNDGVPGITNMYLWQPSAGSFYARCVDGDYDMAVIGHEYGHAISNRMAGGPDASLTGTQARAMGESWSDLMAMEYLNEYALVPTNNESPYAVGAYVTGNRQRGIRNYNMSDSPLNYSDVGYDFVCNPPLVHEEIEGTCPDGRTQVHADGEIWSATNFDIRRALISKYNGSYPASNEALQRKCADGTIPTNRCPGNRRWIQIVFDAWLLMPGGVSMLDARDAYFGADMLRTGGANHPELWLAFARRGMGHNAGDGGGPSAVDPVPGFMSPRHPEVTIRFRVFAADLGNAPITSAEIFVGKYEAAATPIADTIPNSSSNMLGDTARFVTGEYEFLVNAPGYGHLRFPRRVPGGTRSQTIDIFLSTNRASVHKGAVATGVEPAVELNQLIDDTEETVWTGAAPVEGHFVTVDLAGGVQNVKRVNVSAMLEPLESGRFRALRQFEIWGCTAGGATTCTSPTDFAMTYRSPADAFPGVRPRPVAPELILRSFDVPNFSATHVQLRVVDSQCTAEGTGFRGDQDNDIASDSDCVSGSEADDNVRAAELQVFTSTPALPPRDPVVAVAVDGPLTAAAGTTVRLSASYTNAGPAEAEDATLTALLPQGLAYISASDGGSFDPSTRTVTWSLGDVNPRFTGGRSLKVRVDGDVGSILATRVDFTAPETTAVPGVHVLTVTP
jgi:uncharacterized repeat protein (TIGR01451 family)